MPELPDIEVFTRNLKKQFAGQKLVKFKVVNGKKLKDPGKKLSTTLEGKKLLNVYRSGKEMRFEFSGKTILGLHLMLTGDLRPFTGKNEWKSTIVEFHFPKGSGLALTDRMKNANVKLDPEDKAGIDALDRKLNFKTFKNILDRKANIKNVLLDQEKIRGIGNGYADEILWRGRISPFSVAVAIPDEKVKELLKQIKLVLRESIKKIYKKYPGLVHGEVRDFMQIHTKTQSQSPTGAPIKKADRGMLKTYYTNEQVLYK
ncbi:MAG: DNA-formamidopyrimidine glycosylase family protein [Chitinophagaceae bacterium]